MNEYSKDPIATLEGPEVKISCISNLYVRMMTFKTAGIIELGHTHEYDHVTMLTNGALEVQVFDDNKNELLPPVVFNAPNFIYIKKNTAHQLKSLEDNTVALCIHALREIDGTIVQPDFIPVPLSLKDAISYFEDMDTEIKSPLNTVPKIEQLIGTRRVDRAFDRNNKI